MTVAGFPHGISAKSRQEAHQQRQARAAHRTISTRRRYPSMTHALVAIRPPVSRHRSRRCPLLSLHSRHARPRSYKGVPLPHVSILRSTLTLTYSLSTFSILRLFVYHSPSHLSLPHMPAFFVCLSPPEERVLTQPFLLLSHR